MIGPDFYDSDAGKLATIAKRFLEGAATLDAAPPEKRRMLHLPTLALAGHGLEVLLKACVYLNGEIPPMGGRDGHDIGKLWSRDVCEPVRGHVLINARLTADEDRMNGAYSDIPAKDEVEQLIYEYVAELGRLHGKGDYALRYPSPPTTMAPRTPLLVGSLWRTADDFVKRPNDFLVQQFRDRILPFC